MSKKLFLIEEYGLDTEKKCPSCNWEVACFYGIGETVEEAAKNYQEAADDEYGKGLCSQCIVELIIDEKLIISEKEKGFKNYIIFDAERPEDHMPYVHDILQAKSFDEAHKKFKERFSRDEYDVTIAEITEMKSFCDFQE